jgi:uncharacterized protein (UPF0335 family)
LGSNLYTHGAQKCPKKEDRYKKTLIHTLRRCCNSVNGPRGLKTGFHIPSLTRDTTMMSDSDRADQMGQATREKLRQFIARIERLEGEKAELASDIRDVYAEMKTFGLDTKVMRKVIALRKQDANERAEQEALLDLYMEASDGV